MRKSANMITDDAVKMITGIENIEVFLEENDEWQFHFSKVSSGGSASGLQSSIFRTAPTIATVVVKFAN